MTPPIKTLYIEDDELDRDALLQIVQEKKLHYDMTAVETLADARPRLAETHFDVILADYHLPDGNCSELFDELGETPLILMTGTLDEQLALRTLERGADDYLPKDRQRRHLEALGWQAACLGHRWCHFAAAWARERTWSFS
jgi:CheY-like chemotaxis protein